MTLDVLDYVECKPIAVGAVISHPDSRNDVMGSNPEGSSVFELKGPELCYTGFRQNCGPSVRGECNVVTFHELE